jgi:hypothetical protein
MSEILNPQTLTYWLASDGGGYTHGETLALQQTTLGAGWQFVYVGSDQQAFLAACQAAGVTPQLRAASVSARQVRLWLVGAGIPLATVAAVIDAIEDPAQREMIRVEWEYAPYIERTHPMLGPLGAALGLTAEQIDAAFVQAATL